MINLKHLHICFALSSLAFLQCVTGCGGNSESAAIKGANALHNGEYKAAAKAFNKAIKVNPQSSALRYNLGVALARADRHTEAVRAFEDAVRLDPSNVDAAEHMGDSLRISGDLLRSHEMLERAVSMRKDAAGLARVLNSLAVTEKELHCDDLALLRLLRAERVNPGYAATYYNLAKLYSDAFQLYPKAISLYEKFKSMCPSGDPQIQKADEQIARIKIFGDVRAASGRTTNAAAADLIGKGMKEYSKKRWQSAEELFQKALTSDPSSYEAALMLANTRYSSGRLADAAETFVRAAELAPEQLQPVLMQAQIAYSANNPVKAMQILSGIAIPKWPNEPKSYEIAAYSRAVQRRYYDARLYAESYVELAGKASQKTKVFENWLQKLPDVSFGQERQ